MGQDGRPRGYVADDSTIDPDHRPEEPGFPSPVPDPESGHSETPDVSESEIREMDEELRRIMLGPSSSRAASPGPARGLAIPPGYEVLEIIGRGGMGVVYKARHLHLDRIVALKTILGARLDSPEILQRFEVEARVGATLNHPNIVQVHDVDEVDGTPFLSLEYVDGGDLGGRLDLDRVMGHVEASRIIEVVARAAHAAHGSGIVHRDLKPSNILLTSAGVPKLADFGVAKLLSSDPGITQTRQTLGTPSYMAPEQAEGHSRHVGAAADIYALGAILYHALTGRPPFLGGSANETIRMVISAEAVPPRQLRPDVPRDLETICLKCLEKEPSRRYPAAQDLADDLRRFLEGRPIAARPVGPVGRLWRWARRDPKTAGLSAAVASVLVVATVVSTVLAIRATRAEAATRRQRDRAEAFLEFVRTDMLGQATAFGQLSSSLKPDPDLKLRTALDRAAERIGDRFSGQPLVEASIRLAVGEMYHLIGLYPRALPQLRRAVDLRRDALGPDDPDTLVAMKSLGRVSLADGKFAEAEPLLVGALEGLRRLQGPPHPELPDAMALVGFLEYARGKYAESVALFGEAREAYHAARRGDDPEALDVGNGLATAYLGLNKLDLAERTLDDVLARSEKALGRDHPVTSFTKHNLSDFYQSRGRGDEAEKLLIEVVADQTRVLGRAHPSTLTSMVKLGMLQAARGMTDRAEPLLSEALAGCRAALDRNHEAIEGALAGLADVYARKKDWGRLGPVLAEATEISIARLGIDHPQTAQANAITGQCFLRQRDYARAEPYLRDYLAYAKGKSDQGDRPFHGLLYGFCLIAGEKFVDAKAHLLAGYNGIGASRGQPPAPDHVSLGWLVEQVRRLRDANGRPLSESTILSIPCKDPALEMILLDHEFPDKPIPAS